MSNLIKSINKKHKDIIEKDDDYEYIASYKQQMEDDKFKYFITVRHKYCNKFSNIILGQWNIGKRPHRGKDRCCCGCYENSIAYHIEQELKIDINSIWNWDKNNINPYHTSKGYNGHIWLYCLNKKYHNYNKQKDLIGYNIICNNFLKGKRCTYCGNRKTHYFDSLGFLYHDIAKMIVEDERNGLTWEDTYSIAPKSNKSFYFKCSNCGVEKNKKLTINQITYYDLSCEFCSDGISIPEKFISNMLKQLNIDFITQYKFSWSSNRRYDFYIPSLNMIIETHGAQHYKDINWKTRSLEDEQINDKYKRKLALDNGVEKYIIINCSKSTFEWLKENSIKEFKHIFNLNNIKWQEIWQDCQKSKCVQAWDLWNKGTDVFEISQVLNVSIPTIQRYLKEGNKTQNVTYGGEKYRIEQCKKKNSGKNAYNSKSIICLTTKRIFYTITEASKYFKISDSIIIRCCKGKSKSAGKYNGEKLVWRYITWNHGKKFRIKKIIKGD